MVDTSSAFTNDRRRRRVHTRFTLAGGRGMALPPQWAWRLGLAKTDGTWDEMHDGMNLDDEGGRQGSDGCSDETRKHAPTPG